MTCLLSVVFAPQLARSNPKLDIAAKYYPKDDFRTDVKAELDNALNYLLQPFYCIFSVLTMLNLDIFI